MERQGGFQVVGCCLGVLLLIVAGIGCGKTESPEPTAENKENTKPQVSQSSKRASKSGQETPADVVHQFLTAIREGEKDEAESLLTPLALKKIQEEEIEVSEQGFAAAEFEVGEFEIHEDGAQVRCDWKEKDTETGRTKNDTVTWLLRKEKPGWRIVGLMFKLFENEPPRMINFEKPRDMLRVIERSHEEMALRDKATKRSNEERVSPQAPVDIAVQPDPSTEKK